MKDGMTPHVGSTTENVFSEFEEARAECSCGWNSGEEYFNTDKAMSKLQEHYADMKEKGETTL